jgi:peptide/nickel transport system substrate-binding protein
MKRWMVAAAFASQIAIADAASLRIGLQGDADALDPAQGASFVGRIIFAALCDKLVDVDRELRFVPQLATAWQWAPDGKTLTMKMRPDVVFHDGEKLDAEAVRVNLERYRSAPESRRKAELRPISGVEVVDPSTIKLSLAEAYAPLLSVLSDRAGMMMSPRAIAAMGDKIASNPVCSGPFRFAQRVAQERIVVDRFDRHWNAAAFHVDRVTYMIIPDNNVRLDNLRAGALDMIERVAPSDVAAVRREAKLKLVDGASLAYHTMSINVAHGPKAELPLGRDKTVREAFEAAIDRKVINQVVFEGAFAASNQPEIPGSTFFNPERPVPPRDPAKARALLKAAGFDRVTITLRVTNSPNEIQVAEVIQSMASEANIDVKIEATEAATMVAATNRGDYEAAIAIWSGRVDPDGNVTMWLACDGFVNWGKYCNKDLDQIFARARATNDVETRRALYREASAIYLADRPHLFLYHLRWFWALDARVDGFVPYADGIIRLDGVRVRP